MKHCPQCDLKLPDHFLFCGSCGRRLEAAPQELHSVADLYDETMPTARMPSHESNVVPETKDQIPQVRATHTTSEAKSGPTLTILSSYRERETPSQFRWRHRIIFGFLLLLFVSVAGIGGWYLWSQRRSITQTSQASNSNPEPTAENPSTAPSYQPTAAITPQQATIAGTADEELKQLRERHVGAKPSERVEIISALEQAENRYPTDYRFPYELSKLSIKGTTSHHEAFEPLARAAQKAIDNGQAEEMLNRLLADKDGDFHKLSHGHHEWEAIEQALRNKDKRVLKVSAH